MAKYIESVEKTEDLTGLLELTELISARTEQMKELISLMDAIDKSGILTLLKAILQNPDALLKTVSEEMLRDSNVRFIKNASSVYALLSKLDPDRVDRIIGNVTASFDRLGTDSSETPIGILTVIQLMKDPDISAGIKLVFDLLKSIGAASRP